jgi:hypothetical protein
MREHGYYNFIKRQYLPEISMFIDSYIVISNFIGGGTENTQRMSLTNLYHFLNSNGYVRGLVFCSHVENTCMIAITKLILHFDSPFDIIK